MTTFLSYSRVNSEFTLRLAKDLKADGYDVWLDQLDIPTGARWDDEIEKALESCTTFLIILSPQSTQSQNVKDEIGYAIDANKNILPVVVENSKVPFRLRRFQYVDFSNQSYDESLSKIKYLLSNTRELIKPTDVAVEGKTGKPQPPVEKVESREKIEEKPKPVVRQMVEGKKAGIKLNVPALIAIGCAALAILAFVFRGYLLPTKPSETDDVPLAFSPSAIVEKTSTPASSTATPTFIPPSKTATLVPSTPTSFPVEITDSKGVLMRLVPEGDFTAGSDNGELDEKPVHTIYLDAYYIDKYEVTNLLYTACVSEGVCAPPRQLNSFRHSDYYANPQFDNYPVIQVDWDMAKAYCEWREATLPTEAQWEKAARGTDDRTYPWGEGISCANANFGGCEKEVKFVGGNDGGKSSYGVYDLAGNVWEWVADWYSEGYYQYSPSENPLGPDSGVERVMRGGSWSDLGSSSRSSNRHSNTPQTFGNSLGFRCARDVTP